MSATSTDPGHRRALICCLVGLVFSAIMAWQSEGGEGDYDDLEHYLRARWSFHDPRYLLDEWGRPGFTALFAVPAQLGWLAGRLLSGLFSSAAAYLAFACARRLGLGSAWLAAPLTLAQPLFFTLSFTTLTETPTAFYLIAALHLLLCGRATASAAVFSLLLVTRYEMAALLPIWAVALVRGGGRRGWALPVLLWAPLAHNVLAVVAGMPAPVRVFLAARGRIYAAGDPFAFVAHLTSAAGLVIAVLALGGCRGLLEFRRGWLVSASIFTYLAVQTVLHGHGLYGTGGYARFLVTVAPLLGVAATRGWTMLGRREPHGGAASARTILLALALVYLSYEAHRWLGSVFWDRATAGLYRATAVLVSVTYMTLALAPKLRATGPAVLEAIRCLAVLFITSRLVVFVEPLRAEGRHREILDALAYAQRHGMSDRRVHYAGPHIAAAMRTVLPQDRRWFREAVALAQTGDLVIWDEFYGKDVNIDVPLQRLWPNRLWQLRYVSWPRPGHWPSILLFERTD